jgi:hypothetical protein
MGKIRKAHINDLQKRVVRIWIEFMLTLKKGDNILDNFVR